MAWNRLNYACGHTEQVQLYGKMDSRGRTIAAAESHDCPACRAAKAKSDADADGLQPLTGSDKQVAWAAQIRAEILAQVPALEARMAGYQAKVDANDFPVDATPEKIAAVRAELLANAAALKKLMATTKAGWWIDQRGMSINAIIISIKGA